MGLQAGPAGDAGQDEAAALGQIAVGQGGQDLFDPFDRFFEQFGQQAGQHRFHRHEQDSHCRASSSFSMVRIPRGRHPS